MVDFVKYDMTDIWASSGDITAPSSGKIATGWIVEAVPRQWWNWFENRQDNNIAYMLQKGIPEWDAVTEYQTNKSYIQRNSVVYKCILANSNQDPAISPTYWIKAFPDATPALESISGLTPAADRVAYYTGANSAALMTVTAFARTLLDDANVTTMRSTLGAQASHVNLTALSGVTAATNTIPYWNSATTMLASPLTAFGRDLLGDVDAVAGRATLGLGTISTYDVTTSTLDNTAGRISKVGDFGENGGIPLSQGSGVDANTLTVSATYIFPSGGINLPLAAAFYLKHISYPIAGYAKQFAWNISTNTAYMRTQQSSSWSAWSQDASFDDVTTALVPYALKGANSDITSLSGLTTALSVAQGGTGTTTSTGTGNTVRSASPTFTGVPLSTTASPGTNTTQIATTAFVAALGALKANLASPTFTGVPLVPTASQGNNSQQIASTSYVDTGLAAKQNSLGFTPVQQGTGVGQTTNVVKIGWSVAAKLKATVDSTDLGNIALEASPTFTGVPLAPTAAVNTNTTQLATTAYTVSQINASTQTFLTDGTAGKLMVVGAFGLGSAGVDSANVVTNITGTIRTGFYKFNGGATGAPPQLAGVGGSLIVHSMGGNYLQQIVISIPTALDNPVICIRHYDTSGNPGQWRTLYTNANVIGAVAVSGIVPTGAIIETGTNASGTYTKYADGTLICQGSIADLAVGANAQATLSGNGTFAHPFVSGAYYCQVMGAPSTTNDQYGFTSVNSRATSAVNFVHRNGATAQTMVNIRFVAIGRWF